MSYRRGIIVVVLLALAGLACSLGSSGTSVPPTSAPAAASKTPVNFHNGGVTPEDGATQEATAGGDQPTDVPTKAPKPAATKAPTKSPTKAPKPTATDVAQTSGVCGDTLTASREVYWVTVDKNNKIVNEVTTYPDGTTEIVPVFEYDCNPSAFSLVTVFSLDGKQVFSDKQTLKANDQHDVYGYPLVTQDNSPIANGEWSVAFYNAKQLITTGKVEVGGSGGNSNGNGNGNGNTSSNTSTVTVQGTVTAKSGGKPIAGAIFAVLNEGVTIDQFTKDNFADSDVLSAAKTDSSGQFTLADPLKRNTNYSILVVAKGFKTVATDSFTIADTDPNPLVVDVQLSK